MKQTPTVKSFLIADQVFRQDNGKWCVIGVFEAIHSLRFPAMHPSLGLYLKLADASGTFDLGVEFHDGGGRCVARMGGVRLQVPDRLMEVGVGFQTHNLLIPAAGVYHFKLFFDGQPAEGQDIRLDARLIKEA